MRRSRSLKQTEKLYYVYRLHNKINGKSYIGITVNISKRWKGHIQAALGHKGSSIQRVQRAMKKYGIDNFTFEVIEFGVPASKIDEREVFWIDYYHTLDPFGYNIAPGGLNVLANEKPTLWNGVLYPSRQAAVKAVGMDEPQMNAFAKRGFTSDPYPDGIVGTDEIERLLFPDADDITTE